MVRLWTREAVRGPVQMYDYLSMSNLGKATALGGLAALLSIPRILAAGMAPDLYIPAAVFAMIAVSGAATAWGKAAGMVGIIPPRDRLIRGLALAGVAVTVIAPLQHFRLDPVFRRALETLGDPGVFVLRYPASLGGCLALILWSGSFETMFFCAAPMSFFGKLTGRQSIAVFLSVGLRIVAVSEQIALYGVTDSLPLFFISGVIGTTALCLLFARYGLPAAALFAAGTNVHVLMGL